MMYSQALPWSFNEQSSLICSSDHVIRLDIGDELSFCFFLGEGKSLSESTQISSLTGAGMTEEGPRGCKCFYNSIISFPFNITKGNLKRIVVRRFMVLQIILWICGQFANLQWISSTQCSFHFIFQGAKTWSLSRSFAVLSQAFPAFPICTPISFQNFLFWSSISLFNFSFWGQFRKT